MESWGSQNFADCQLGDKRLNQRAREIGQALVVGFGQALSMIFKEENPLKRAYEFLANPKAQFNLLTRPHRENTARETQNLPVILAVGDTTFLDYKNIKAKQDGYGPIGNGGNGLILHTTLAARASSRTIRSDYCGRKFGIGTPKSNQPLMKLPNRKKHVSPQSAKPSETDPLKKKNQARWVEALTAVEKQFQKVGKQFIQACIANQRAIRANRPKDAHHSYL